MRATAQMFAAHPDITGVIAASGLTSIHAAQAVAATGRSVPTDVSIIGVGGDALAQWCVSEITHVDLALGTCARAAGDYIAAHVSGTPAPPNFSLKPRIVHGRSVTAARG